MVKLGFFEITSIFIFLLFLALRAADIQPHRHMDEETASRHSSQ